LAAVVAVTAAALSRDVAAGDVVVLACPTGPEFVVAFLAILAAGARAFPISPESTSAELRAAAGRSGAVAAIGTDAAVASLDVRTKRSPPKFESHGVEPPVRLVARDTSRAGLLLQSSGTTGLPKIVFRSAASLDAVAEAMRESIGIGANDRVLMCLPLCHSYGIEHGLLAPLMAGSCVHLLGGFDFSAALAQLRDAGITIFPGVPFMFEALSRLDGAETLPSLRRAYSAGGPLPRQVYDRFHDRFRIRVSQLYGATEIGSVTYADPLCGGFDPAAVGRPMRGVSVRILDPVEPKVSHPLPAGAEGHVAVSAPSMLSEYVGDAAPATVDGYFLTGDLGSLDAGGNLTVTGRTKLLIDIGGRKVNPLEVEAVLAQHPLVERCVVVPVHVSETVSRLKAIVVARRGAQPPLAPDALRRFARDRLVPYKVPRIIEIRPSLPTSPTGKVLRHLVAA
jgi:acyl-CoA synthetase (AMP-forming)/AMP-acid ligase II